MHLRPRAAYLTSAIFAMALFASSAAIAATANLPAGTPISVDITSPADGTIFDVPAGTSSLDIGVDVSASVSEGIDAPDTALIYVIDLSGSTIQGGGCGGNQNPAQDNQSNTILDCEIAALRGLNDAAIAAGTVGTIGVVGFAENAVQADLSPDPGVQTTIAPADDLSPLPGNDLDAVLQNTRYQQGRFVRFTNLTVGNSTNFQAAVQQACGLAGSLSETNRTIAFVSDGDATTGGNAVTAATGCPADILTFATGPGADCNSTGSNSQGSLQQIAAQTGNSCTEVDTPADLPDIVRDLVGSTLDDVTLDGTPAAAGLPLDGPASVTDTVTRTIVPGLNVLTATATGTDRDGPGSVQESISVFLNRMPTVAVGDETIPEGSSATVTAVGGDDDGDTLTYAWDLDGDGFFDDATGATAVVPGPDGLAIIPVAVEACDATSCATDSATVTVTNVAPTVDAGPDQTVNRNDVVNLSGSFTDPATTLDELYAWDFGGLASGDAAYGDVLPASTSFPLEGFYDITLEVTDEDGETGSDTVTIEVLNVAPDCTAVAPNVDTLWPPNHSLHTITLSGATDVEGDTLVTTIDSVHQDEPVNGNGDGNTSPDAFINGDTVDLRAERAGGGDGRYYHVAYTVDDGHGGSCSGVVTVTVDKSKGKNGAAVDQGPLYDSTVA